MNLESLQHVEKTLPNGGLVLVLNTGAVINQEAEAMLQALHSRSIGGIKNHLQVLRDKGSEKFMSTFYVGYGHKSIGDCGTCTVFIEGVSMLAAKAIQDWPLYSGQEASTRYIDFASQPFYDPAGTEQSQNVLEKWRAFYMKGLSTLGESLPLRFPRGEDEEEKTYLKAINARAFDVMRSFLPAGATTNLAWHTNFRQAADHLARLRHHPLEEVRKVADVTEVALSEAFPSSFGQKQYESTEKFNESWMGTKYYYTASQPIDFALTEDAVDLDMLEKFKENLRNRPAKTEVPKEVAECGQLQFKFLLDFGSFRDVQRHRAVVQRMPLVTDKHGFEGWYLQELPEDFAKEAQTLLEEQKKAVRSLGLDDLTRQYYTPMGYKLPNQLTGALNSLVYLVELRSTRFVHPTLRKRAIQMAKALSKKFEESGLVIHLDTDPDRFDIKRGEHDITLKK